jgi:hypothetical protein
VHESRRPELGVVMGLAIAGAVIGGSVALAAVYDYVARRRGRNSSVSLSGPINGAGVRGDSPSHIDLP